MVHDRDQVLISFFIWLNLGLRVDSMIEIEKFGSKILNHYIYESLNFTCSWEEKLLIFPKKIYR